MQNLTGQKLVAHAPLKWTRDGELVAIEPGDIFEVDARDVEIAGIRFDLWLASGAVEPFRERPEKKGAGVAGRGAGAPPGSHKGKDGSERADAPEGPPDAAGEVVP